MPNYRRARTPGGTYFFTLVSYQRQNILCNDTIRTALRDAINITRTKLPFTIDAMVLMPDHLHAVWTLPENDGDYSVRWSMIKRLVTQRVGVVNGAHGAPYDGCGSDVASGAHGAPYGDARNSPSNENGRGFVGCAMRTEEEDIGDDTGIVGCAVRTDINMGRDDDFVGCAMRTEEEDIGDDMGIVGCAMRTEEENIGDDMGIVGCAMRTDINMGRDDDFVGCAMRTEEEDIRDDMGIVGCAMRTEEEDIGDDTDIVGCAMRTNRTHYSNITASRLKRREGNIWQRRFWEHQVRDQDDLNRCIDYVHWNPVKHGYASRVADWPYSTFHRFVREGMYPEDWGGQGVGDGGGFGE